MPSLKGVCRNGLANRTAKAFMRKIIFILLIALFSSSPAFSSGSLTEAETRELTNQNYRPGKIEHIVLFKYKPEISATEKQLVIKQFLSLKNECLRNGTPYIASIVTGQQNSFEKLDQGYEQAFIVSFNSEVDRNYYAGKPLINDPNYFDPKHEQFKKFIGPLLMPNSEGVLVFDFRVQN